MIFKCTLKVRTALKLSNMGLATDGEIGIDGLDHWYCNVFNVDRRKCLIWMHGRTLFSVLAPGVRQADFRRFGDLFRERAREVLSATGHVSENEISYLLNSPGIYSRKLTVQALSDL